MAFPTLRVLRRRCGTVVLLAVVLACVLSMHTYASACVSPPCRSEAQRTVSEAFVRLMAEAMNNTAFVLHSGDDVCMAMGVLCDPDGIQFSISVRYWATGTLPELTSLGDLSQLYLKSVTFSGRLAGTLPASWAALPHLSRLILSNTEISGTLPENYADMAALERLDLSVTRIGGTLPASWSALPRLRAMVLSHTLVTGTLPPQWASMPALESLELDNTLISGTLPSEWSRLSSLTYLKIFASRISGTLPAEWSVMPNLSEINVQGTAVGGTLPPEWAAMKALRVVDVGDSNVRGTLPPEWGVNATLFYRFSCDNTAISGTLPPEWSGMMNLNTLTISNSQLHGTLPPEYSTMTRLVQFTASNTKLTGVIPSSWDGMIAARLFYFGGTGLTCCLPYEWLCLLELSASRMGLVPVPPGECKNSSEVCALPSTNYTTSCPSYIPDSPFIDPMREGFPRWSIAVMVVTGVVALCAVAVIVVVLLCRCCCPVTRSSTKVYELLMADSRDTQAQSAGHAEMNDGPPAITDTSYIDDFLVDNVSSLSAGAARD